MKFIIALASLAGITLLGNTLLVLVGWLRFRREPEPEPIMVGFDGSRSGDAASLVVRLPDGRIVPWMSRDEAMRRFPITRETLDRINASEPPRRLRDRWSLAEGGVVQPKRMCDSEAAQTIHLAPGGQITTYEEAEALGLTGEFNRYWLNRWTSHDSRTTPPTEGEAHDGR